MNNAPNFQNQGFQNQPFSLPNNQFQPDIPNKLLSYMKSNETLIKNMQNQINVLRGDFNKQEEDLRRNLNDDMRSILGSFFHNQALTLGTLPKNTVPSPKGEMKAITTHSGLAYEGPSIPINSPLEKIVEQDTEETTNEEHSVQFKEYLESSFHAISPVLPTKEPEYSLSMGYEHPNTTPETKSDEIIKSGVEELVPILNECEVTSEDKRDCDVFVCEDSSTFDVCDDHYEILSNSNNDDISSDDDAFEDIEYVEASLPDPEIVSLEKEIDVYQEDEEVDLEDIFQIQDVVLREKLLSINCLIANIESLNDNPTPDCVLKSSDSFPIFEESDNSLSGNSSPEFETFSDHTEETRSGNTTTHAYNSLPEYDSLCFEIEPDQERLTSIIKNDISDDSTNDPL
nr:hypothetical protein [Tanacetum cinerariifolium]